MSKLLAKGDDMADDARNVAVLIDFENLNESESLSAVLDRAAEHGTVVTKLAVGDYGGNVGKVQSRLQRLGILPVQQASAGKGKNSSDMRLAIEAIDLFHDQRRSIDVFVFATSDADFVPLALWLRASGRYVVGAGSSGASKKWQDSVDEYVIVKTDEPPQQAAKSTAGTKKKKAAKSKSSKSSKASSKPTDPQVEGQPAKSNVLNPEYREIIETAIDDVFSNGLDEVKSPMLLKRIVQLDPQFSCKKAGFNRFRKLVESFDHVRVPANPSTGDFAIRKRGAQKAGG